jgi:hypothetical protein
MTERQYDYVSRNPAQAATIALLRAFVNQFLRFPPVTNADHIEMRITSAWSVYKSAVIL